MLNVSALTVRMQQNAERSILDHLSFDVNDGEILAILGPSGAGKTTLLRCLALLHKQTAGRITFNGAPIDTLAPGKVGIVFQGFNLFPHLTVLENLLLAPKCHKKDTSQALNDKAKKLLCQFGLESQIHVYPHSLSGGQKQRVAIARALMMDPPVLLFDEPTSALDPELINEVSDIIKALRQPNRVILVVTHEVRLARHVADQILFMNNGMILDNVTNAVFFNESGDGLSGRAKIFLSNLS
ncbi:MAG: ATP-binding cassette domain-containing protein [Candidatus Paracaedibacteraceae bacterium]|nr:ATP-binding cassette domain-containing protein [Candidatus Paracaedibacteraceae bacterium]